jgi:hypothetical protein
MLSRRQLQALVGQRARIKLRPLVTIYLSLAEDHWQIYARQSRNIYGSSYDRRRRAAAAIDTAYKDYELTIYLTSTVNINPVGTVPTPAHGSDYYHLSREIYFGQWGYCPPGSCVGSGLYSGSGPCSRFQKSLNWARSRITIRRCSQPPLERNDRRGPDILGPNKVMGMGLPWQIGPCVS